MFWKRADRIKGIAGSLTGSTVLVGDSVAGAGPGIVRTIAEAGAAVIATSADRAMLDVELSRARDTPGQITGLAVDPAVGSLADTVPTHLTAPLDGLVLNPRLDSTEDTRSWLALANALMSQMRDTGTTGSVVFITGINRRGPEGAAAAALQARVEDLAADFAANAIRVNAVAPGPIGANRRGRPRSHSATPLGHVTLHPVEIGKAVWFLLNDDLSAGITGATINVDRGASLLRPNW